MAANAPSGVPRAKLFKMISTKGISKRSVTNTDFGTMITVQDTGFRQMGKALNSIGASVNSIAIMLENMNASFRDSVQAQIRSQEKIADAQDDAAKDTAVREEKDIRAKRKEEGRAADDLAEAKQEGRFSKFAGKVGFAAGMVAGKVANGMMNLLANLGSFFMSLVGFASLDWISRNPEKVQKIVDFMVTAGKFVYQVASWLTGVALDGITDFMENPISLKGLLGIGKFFLVLAAIFAGPTLAKLGLKLLLKGGYKLILKPLFSLLKGVGKLLFNMTKVAAKGIFKAGKFLVKNPKVALGVAAVAGVAALGKMAYDANQPNTGVEGGKSQAEETNAYGGMTGDPMSMLAMPDVNFEDIEMPDLTEGMDPKALEELAKQQVAEKLMYSADEIKAQTEEDSKKSAESQKKKGGNFWSALKPIFQPIIDLFNGVKDMFVKVVGFFKSELDDTIGFFGELFGTVKEFISPYVDKLKRLGGGLLKNLLLPYVTMFTAVQKVLDIFKKKEDEDKKKEMARGGPLPQKAKGGWISGPQSGYPVSLTGQGVDFIGHGTEWVGMKGYASGGSAFVVPFDTPATKANPGLTNQRWGEAMRGGYQLPGFAEGGVFDFAKKMIKIHEGSNIVGGRHRAYKDSKGYPTIGYGHLIKPGDGYGMGSVISQSEADKLFNKDFNHHLAMAQKIPGYKKAHPQAKAALIDLTFNMGGSFWKGFPKFTAALKAGNYNKAGEELRDSAWYSEVGRRAEPIISLIKGKGTGGASYLRSLKPPTNTGTGGDQLSSLQQGQEQRIESAASERSQTKVAQAPTVTQKGQGSSGGQSTSRPAIVGLPQRAQAAAKYMIPRFGLMNEINTPPTMLT
jgi:GH24 family phage-related lysozyme (muramidase)/exonuclease VII small subunit